MSKMKRVPLCVKNLHIDKVSSFHVHIPCSRNSIAGKKDITCRHDKELMFITPRRIVLVCVCVCVCVLSLIHISEPTRPY